MNGGAVGRFASVFRERGMGAGILIAAISTAFAVVLITATGYIAAIVGVDGDLSAGSAVAVVLGTLTVVLVGLALYVAAIVTANTFATVVAGRTRQIALMRLIGATARMQRRSVAGRGLLTGAVGAAIGLVVGVIAARAGIAVLGRLVPELTGVEYTVTRLLLTVPAIVVTLTTWAAAWSGSRRVLTVTPLQALGASAEVGYDRVRTRTARHVAALILVIIGVLLLAAGVALGLITPLGVLVAFVGGVLSFTGLVLGATLVMPPVLRLVGALFGRSTPARLAAQNAPRHPERSSRMAIGVVMGVTLITMFAVALSSSKAILVGTAMDAQQAAAMEQMLSGTTSVAVALVAVCAVIAAVGLVNLLVLGVIQRRRELALLRALGLSTGQIRTVVLLEAAHITIASVLTGLVLGIGYGWVAAQSMFGSISISGTGPHLVAPAVPVGLLVAIVVATAVLTLAAAVAPTRIATRVSPVAALAG